MKCPKCRETDLDKASFNEPYVCQSCEGMWVHSDQMSQWPETSEMLADIIAAGDTDHKTGLCPEGHGIMIRARVDVEKPFYLEKCLHCNGIWFDQGEWQRVVQNHLAETIDMIWCTAWQRKQRLEKEQEKYLELNKSLLGEEVFEEIMALASRLAHHPQKLRAVAFLQNQVLGR